MRNLIFQLSETQIQRFTDFALARTIDRPPSPFPFRAARLTRRIDPYDAMSLHIFSNRDELKLVEARLLNCPVAN